ncbi:PRC-barrel domain-containing protein [Aeoliella sp.]|uniref:PRC-barrel domain-containing protein n=1 Tax=Aeoliella sp. TaxID=2795800 RepID=UPI003CCC3BC2
MKNYNLAVGAVAILMATCVGMMSTSTAQNATREATKQQPQQYESRRPNLSERSRSDSHHKQGHVVRASNILGHNIVNGQDKNVGEISDLVLDPATGKIRYAAVTYGGFIGIGDKLFAVPWEAFSCRVDPENSDDYIVTLNVTQEQLEGAEGFDQDNWPNFADPEFAQDLDKRYGVKRDRRGVNVEVGRGGVDVDVNPRD